MTNKAIIQAIQRLLLVNDDGIWGTKSQAALDALMATPAPAEGALEGSIPGWEFMDARVDGEDIVIENADVTAFGGADDKMDSGETASGVSTKDNPDLRGCALPMRRDGSPAQDKQGRKPILRGSPIPKIPWFTDVIFTDTQTGTNVSTKLIDEGPAGYTKQAGDLTVAAARVFDPHATANNANIPKLTIRIVGGAQYV